MVKPFHTCTIALGSNLGDRLANLAHARKWMMKKIKVKDESSIYETEPWGVTDQPRFLNQVVVGQTSLSPEELLHFLKQIEIEMGRVKTIRFGPRLIDLDILLMGNLEYNSPDLTIPHPRMTERAFVLVPLAEIAPNLVIPGTDQTITELCKALDLSGVCKFESKP